MEILPVDDGDSDAFSASEAVVRAVSAEEEIDPLDLSKPLYDVIDPDALNVLMESLQGGSGHIAFEYYGYHVRVDSTGYVEVEAWDTDKHGLID